MQILPLSIVFQATLQEFLFPHESQYPSNTRSWNTMSGSSGRFR